MYVSAFPRATSTCALQANVLIIFLWYIAAAVAVAAVAAAAAAFTFALHRYFE
jgi:hypothetical protein